MSFYYVAPKTSMEFILREGIKPPSEVRRLIENGVLPPEVIGFSYATGSSHFPDYVSMNTKDGVMRATAMQIFFDQHNESVDIVAYRIDSSLRRKEGFLDEAQTKMLNQECLPGEVLFNGLIPPELIRSKFVIFEKI